MIDTQPPIIALSMAAKIPGVSWDENVVFNQKQNAWIGTLSVEIPVSSLYVPRVSSWHCLIDKTYPLGSIRFYPSKENGITVTFHHQDRNRSISPDCPWMNGKPCLTEPFGTRVQTSSNDPIGNSDERLAWYTSRLVDWLEAAASDTLILPGDHYETPQYPQPKKISEHFSMAIHDESYQTFSYWKHGHNFGRVNLGLIDGLNNVICLTSFSSFIGSHVVRQWQGRSPNSIPESLGTLKGYWILTPAPVALPPWQAPETWGELRDALKPQSINLDSILEQIASETRDIGPSLLLVGFPIPLKHADPPQEIFWSGILIPMLTSGGKPPDGFRSNKLGLWRRDRQSLFSDPSQLGYVKVENWDKARLCSRGHLPEEMLQSRCAIIGLGSLGSQVAMSMARMGIEQLVLIDGESISAGNIARHTATLRDVEMKKTDLVSTNIKAVSPYIEITSYSDNLNGDNISKFLSNAKIIVDCSGNDEVLHILEGAWFPVPKIWVCACVGYGASRIYVYTARGHSFPVDNYFKDISPWLKQDGDANPDIVEGAGCWHPLFPARQDDMLLAAAICTKVISEASHATPRLGLQVFEQSQMEGFYNISRVYPPLGNPV